jgi:xylan 1,4-beta-xylosidase
MRGTKLLFIHGGSNGFSYYCRGLVFVVAVLVLLALACLSEAAASINIQFTFNKNNSNAFHKPFLECVGSGHAKLGLRSDWQKSLLVTKNAIGFKRIRFHGLLDDDMNFLTAYTTTSNIEKKKSNNNESVVVSGNKKYIFNFTQIQRVFDFLIYEANVMPYIELSFMPGILASGKTTYLHYKARTDPPKNYSDWGDAIKTLGNFLVKRYGIENVSTLYFEVW